MKTTLVFLGFLIAACTSAADDVTAREKAFIAECHRAADSLGDSLCQERPDCCQAARKALEERHFAELDAACRSRGGRAYANPNACIREREGKKEYLDLMAGYWDDCQSKFAEEPGDSTDCGWPGQPKCLVPPPSWCP